VATITVRVTPRSRRRGVDRGSDGLLRVRVRAAPEDGEANAEATDVLAEALDVPKGAVRVRRGGRARTKILVVEGLTDHELATRIQGL
jgi:uncharacterized protein YggU (UPF0235/DUF167 family)